MNRRLIALLGIGLAVRLALLPVGGYGYDLTLMQSWAERLVTRPWSVSTPRRRWSTISRAICGCCGCLAERRIC